MQPASAAKPGTKNLSSAHLRPIPKRTLRLPPMFDLILAGAVAAGLLVYLLWALLRPEDL
jgi:K+-transporting ATPase KdpF subunit